MKNDLLNHATKQFYIEQQIPRLVDKRKKNLYYSGKKKRHIIKIQRMANNHAVIIDKTRYKKEHRQGWDIYKKNYSITPKEVVNVCEFGYLGVEKGLSRTKIRTTI